MSDLAVAALALVAVWLLALTVVVMLVVRQVALVTIRLDRGRDQAAPVRDGLPIGSELPPAAVEVVPAQDAGPSFLLILAAICGPCRELARSLRDLPLAGRAAAVISGSPDLAAELAAQLPDGIRVVLDPAAEAVVSELAISTTPFVFEVRDGRIAAKVAVQGPEHLSSFVGDSLDDRRGLEGPIPLEVIVGAS